MEKKIPKLSVQLLAAIAVVSALGIIVENVFSIRFSNTLQLQFTFLTNTILGAIAGPIWSALVALIIDPIAVLMSGQTFILGFTVIEVVSGFLYGLFFYRKKLNIAEKKDWLYVAMVVCLILLVTSFVMTPVVLHYHFKTPWIVLYSSRVTKAVVEIPMRIVVTMLIMPQLQRIPEIRKLMGLPR
ncbi:folate family ECF transporter S component [Streptococcus sp. zg-86]|uniref:Folate family ECF transporter S component n=1 Tax=Streptococcus zhangguiae TaxID=2664091 RepID=A0A6I4RG36_9STRE|nr:MULTISPECIES: folate family ECF transporter S component [unclassified Streptococcus]MTB63835.1 folate family ECF transporter S component [Streptococcus sp. zg-86]MTB90145.1 folate family ECF transporter S component [Streptococcus sp. zg-36]MWV55817.1 folate family ECF transporter S component [Streptococcus sp. zg-70]QTH47900.1 folate family ECF transporter S component [Streptococcus sp. zg-86]